MRSPGRQASYTLEATLPPRALVTPGAAPVTFSRVIDQSAGSTHVLYNLPANTNLVLVPVVPGITPTGAAGNVAAGVFVVNTGSPQTPTTPNLPVGPPYYRADLSGPCGNFVELTNLAVQASPDPPSEFLQSTNLGEFSAAIQSQITGATDAYYLTADPRGLRRDLTDFKAKNGFPADEIVANYANSGDLGFGRQMHCRRQLAVDGVFDVACYVTNFGTWAPRIRPMPTTRSRAPRRSPPLRWNTAGSRIWLAPRWSSRTTPAP